MMWKTAGAWERKYSQPPPLSLAALYGLPESELSKMTIKGLTDREEELPRIGELRKGAARTEEDLARKRPGKDLGPTFRFTAQDPATAERFKELYGEAPQRLLVYLPGKTAAENFDAWNEKWVAGGLDHRCDGEVCTVWKDEKGNYQHTPLDCPGGCKQVGRLRVMLPDLEHLAYVTALTSSKHDILNLSSHLRKYQSLAGSLHGILFELTRIKRKVSTPGAGDKRVRREKWLLSLQPSTDWVRLKLEGMRMEAQLQIEGAGASIVDAETGEITEAAPEPEDDNGWTDADYTDPGHIDEDDEDESEQEDTTTAQARVKFRRHFYTGVLEKIPYYRDGAHISKTLKGFGYTAFNAKNEDDMLADLEIYANEKADEEAEAE